MNVESGTGPKYLIQTTHNYQSFAKYNLLMHQICVPMFTSDSSCIVTFQLTTFPVTPAVKATMNVVQNVNIAISDTLLFVICIL